MRFTQSYTIPILPGSQIAATWLVFAKDSTLGMNVFRLLPVKALGTSLGIPRGSTDKIAGAAI